MFNLNFLWNFSSRNFENHLNWTILPCQIPCCKFELPTYRYNVKPKSALLSALDPVKNNASKSKQPNQEYTPTASSVEENQNQPCVYATSPTPLISISWRNFVPSRSFVLESQQHSSNVIDRYYQIQSLYLRLLAEHEMSSTSPLLPLVDEEKDEEPEELATPQVVESEGNVEPERSQEPERKQRNTRTGTIACSSNSTAPADHPGYHCPRCGNAYSRPHSLNRHIRFECGVEPQFECPVCHKKSKHKHNLVLHMRTHQKS